MTDRSAASTLEWGEPAEHATIARDGCIIRSLVGSNLHGLVREGTDDRDEMGVCIEPRERVIGLQPFEHWVWRTQPEGRPSGPGDLDLVVYSLRKYCRLALKGSPTVLLLLYVPNDALVIQTDLGERLQALASSLISRRHAKAFLGYLDSQRLGLLGSRHSPNRDREVSERHGYDTKYAMHALRIGHQGIELMEHGHITLPAPEPLRSRLMDVRLGEIPLDDIVGEIEGVQARLEELLIESPLAAEPDVDAVDRFLVESYEEAWAKR